MRDYVPCLLQTNTHFGFDPNVVIGCGWIALRPKMRFCGHFMRSCDIMQCALVCCLALLYAGIIARAAVIFMSGYMWAWHNNHR